MHKPLPRAKKRLGQHFLVNPGVLEKIVQAGRVRPGDRVVEVGPGTGLLTEKLLEAGAKVTAIELDWELALDLRQKFGGNDRFRLIEADVLKTTVEDYRLEAGPYKVVANIPYYITSPILRHFLQAGRRPERMVLLVQREVAEKVCGQGGMSVIALETQIFGKPSMAGLVKPGSFVPPPKVESAILAIEVHPEPLIAPDLQPLFFKLIHGAFAQKRKQMGKVLAAVLGIKTPAMAALLKRVGLDATLRPERLSVADWARLIEVIR